MMPPLPPRVLAWTVVVLLVGAAAVVGWDALTTPDVIRLDIISR